MIGGYGTEWKLFLQRTEKTVAMEGGDQGSQERKTELWGSRENGDHNEQKQFLLVAMIGTGGSLEINTII